MLRLLPILACALGLLTVFAEPLFSGFAQQSINGHDPRFTEFLFEHSWQWLRGENARGIFDLPMGYPLRNTLASAEPMLSFGIFYWPFRALGLSSGASHQLWLMLLGAVNFGCFFAFTRRGLGFRSVSATAAAMLFAFGLPRVAELGHSQLWAQPFIVCIAWGMFALLSDGTDLRGRRLGVLAVCTGFVLQSWGSLYNAIFVAYACALAGLFTLAYPAWRARALQSIRDVGGFAAIAIALSLLCVLPLIESYLAVYNATEDWKPEQIAALQPRLTALFYVWPHSWFYGWLTSPSASSELAPEFHQQALGLGALTTGVVLFTLWRHRRDPWVHLTIALFVFMWLPTVMWPGGWTLWDDLRAILPGVAPLRAIARLGLLLLIPASIALGLFLEEQRTQRARVACLVLGALCILEQGTGVPSYTRPPYDRVVSNIIAEIQPDAEAFYYVGAGLVPSWYSQIDAILAAQRSGVPTVNMYSGRYPTSAAPLSHNISRDPRRLAQLSAALARWAREHELDPARIQLIDQNEIRARRGREFEERRSRNEQLPDTQPLRGS
ncbi:MAG: hypothetical protein VX246_17235 [Myxococcota bacterium]|nr:hypothetical protein [Myxococcota bacterium]